MPAPVSALVIGAEVQLPQAGEGEIVQPELSGGFGEVLGLSSEALLTGIIATLIAAALLAMIRRVRRAFVGLIAAITFKRSFRSDVTDEEDHSDDDDAIGSWPDAAADSGGA